MAVTLNGIAQLEYNRNTELPPHQALYLDKMDKKMDDGIFVGEATISNPDLNQRAQFVAGNLAHAILSDDEAMCAALTAYLALRLPELDQVKITNHTPDNGSGDEQPAAISIDWYLMRLIKNKLKLSFFTSTASSKNIYTGN